MAVADKFFIDYVNEMRRCSACEDILIFDDFPKCVLGKPRSKCWCCVRRQSRERYKRDKVKIGVIRKDLKKRNRTQIAKIKKDNKALISAIKAALRIESFWLPGDDCKYQDVEVALLAMKKRFTRVLETAKGD